MTLAVEVMMITASTSMKLPNVSWPIDSENDRGIVEFGGNSAVMVSGPGSNRRAIYDVFRAVGNMLKSAADRQNWPTGETRQLLPGLNPVSEPDRGRDRAASALSRR